MSNRDDALFYAHTAMQTAGDVHARNGGFQEGAQDFRQIADAILQLVRAIEALAQAIK